MSRRVPDESMIGSGDVRVRRAEPKDAPRIASIYNHYVDAGGATFDTAHWHPQYVLDLINGPDPEGWYVAGSAEDVIGWASIRRYSLRHGYRRSCETAIYLAPEAIGGGAADLLQIRVEQHCRQHGLHHAVARIVADNQRSMAFHYRYGYQLVGIQNEIGHMDGKWIDVAILQRIF